MLVNPSSFSHQLTVFVFKNNSLAICQQVLVGVIIRREEVRVSKVTAAMVS